MRRRAIVLHGVVQGVGFRPFVFSAATRLGLSGFVQNRGGSVLVEVEGPERSLDAFAGIIQSEHPPLARLRTVVIRELPPLGGDRFEIASSDRTSPIVICADAAPCAACMREVLEPTSRRHRYALSSCASCGPRFTLIDAAPYDRERTSMAVFDMCPACRAEYDDPGDRRFHAQPIACPTCGPRLRFDHHRGATEEDPIAATADALRAGAIVAVKGVGGYHLACDASSEAVVLRLRARKQRELRPFAIMVRDRAAAMRVCELSDDEVNVLTSSARPILLARRRAGALIADAVAPRNPYVGVMLPSTPLHALLAEELGEQPLIMTSGNRSDEPIAHDDDDARSRLSNIADAFLAHDRVIRTRCDDSVVRVVGSRVLPLRRSRGYAPEPLPIPWRFPSPVLALGGHMKAAFALGRDDEAVASHHLGDLGDLATYRGWVEAIAHYERLFALRPGLLVRDTHPDYASTRYAIERAEREGLPILAVQHHRAHIASCLADNAVDAPVIGVAFDGTGAGDDGAIWGGEFFVGELAHALDRRAHLRYVPMPGGERAIREPWRMAVAHLIDAGVPLDLVVSHATAEERRIVERMIERRVHSPPTSSVGRLFDAVSAMVTGIARSGYDAHAAMELEWLAARTNDEAPYPFALSGTVPIEIDTRQLVAGIASDVARGVDRATVAARFHASIVEIIATVCSALRAQTSIATVALSGGVFCNALLAERVPRRLARDGFHVLVHCRVPPNDGGLCLGQLAIAAASMRDRPPLAIAESTQHL